MLDVCEFLEEVLLCEEGHNFLIENRKIGEGLEGVSSEHLIPSNDSVNVTL